MTPHPKKKFNLQTEVHQNYTISLLFNLLLPFSATGATNSSGRDDWLASQIYFVPLRIFRSGENKLYPNSIHNRSKQQQSRHLILKLRNEAITKKITVFKNHI